MKKILAMALAILMAFGLCACAEELQGIELPPLPEVTPTPQPTFTGADDPSPSPNEETPEPTDGAAIAGELAEAPTMMVSGAEASSASLLPPGAESLFLLLHAARDSASVSARKMVMIFFMV